VTNLLHDPQTARCFRAGETKSYFVMVTMASDENNSTNKHFRGVWQADCYFQQLAWFDINLGMKDEAEMRIRRYIIQACVPGIIDRTESDGVT